MAHRILNSTIPFSMSTDRPKVDSFKACPDPSSTASPLKANKLNNFSALLLKILSHGTATHMDMGPLVIEKSPFIAQAECESQDSQEFCPNSSSSFCYTQGASSQRRTHRRRRRRQRRRQGEREAGHSDGGTEATRETRLVGVQEQDSGEVGNCHYSSTDCSGSGAVSTESLCVQETVHPPHLFPSHYADGACTSLWNLRLSSPEVFPAGEAYEQESGWSLPSGGDCSLAVAGLRNYVTHADCSFAPPFVNKLVRDVKDEEEDTGDEEEQEKSCINEGILFKKELQADNFEYREGRDYEVCEVLRHGSYGEVYSVRDKTSGFTCAAKKMRLQSFSSEEVGSWSVLQHPHVVELFGFVREGPSIILFMDLKPDSLGQLLKERGRLPEDLSLHYLHQVLGALQHLHRRRILHLDIKAENVLLSEDGKDTFLCDFGQSERLDQHGFSPFRGLKGTETHMAPEVVRSETRCAKADVWSSCCMLLHMLSGYQPWIRYFSRPLYLKIAEEPPPLKEIPPDCSPHTTEVITQGLLKEPSRRSSAKHLQEQTAKALKELGGLRSPARGGAYENPVEKPDRSGPASSSHSSVQQWMGPEHQWRGGAELRPDCKNTDDMEEAEDREDELDEEEEEEECVERSEGYPPLSTKPTEQEFRKLEMDLYVSSLSHLHSAERQEQLLSYLGSDCLSPKESWDKKDSGRWSVGPGDDLSSGVFSYNSQSDGQCISMDWPGPAPQPRCFEGVDVCIKDFNGRCLRIRETLRVKVGHIAVGISDQISERVFSLQCEDGSLVAPDTEVQEAGLVLRCVPAPDCRHTHLPRCPHSCGRVPDCRHTPCDRAPWSWRIRDGELEAWA